MDTAFAQFGSKNAFESAAQPIVWKCIKRNSTDFKKRFVIMDKIWIHYYTPESKMQSTQWIEHDKSVPKKAKLIRSPE